MKPGLQFPGLTPVTTSPDKKQDNSQNQKGLFPGNPGHKQDPQTPGYNSVGEVSIDMINLRDKKDGSSEKDPGQKQKNRAQPRRSGPEAAFIAKVLAANQGTKNQG